MNKKTALNRAIKEYNLEIPNKFSKFKISYAQFIDCISKDTYNTTKDLGYSSAGSTKLIKTLFPDKPSIRGLKICSWLLSLQNQSFCQSCKCVKDLNDFPKNCSKAKGINTYCKICHTKISGRTQAARSSKRRANKNVPKWANLKKITEFYSNCPKGYEVDHIVPLQGINVSGLHVENNLQYLTKLDNLKKSNKF